VPSVARGVGRSCCRQLAANSTTRSFSAIPPLLRFGLAPVASRARGVGKRRTTRSLEGGCLQVGPPISAGDLRPSASIRSALTSCRPCSASATARMSSIPPGWQARMKMRSLRWAAPTSEARRLVQLASYPSVARSPSTRPSPRLRSAATFSRKTSLGRRTRSPSAMVSQSPLRVPYAMRNAGPTAGETDVLAWETGAQHVY